VEGPNHERSLLIEGAIVGGVKELMTTTWNLPETCDCRDKESLTHINEFLDNLDMVCEIARGDRSHPARLKNVQNAILRTVMHAGPQTRAEKLDFEKLRLDME